MLIFINNLSLFFNVKEEFFISFVGIDILKNYLIDKEFLTLKQFYLLLGIEFNLVDALSIQKFINSSYFYSDINSIFKEKVLFYIKSNMKRDTLLPDILPISIKSFNFNCKKKKNQFSFGSIERFFMIEQNFLLIFIGYEQKQNIKSVIFSNLIEINIDFLNYLKGNLSLKDIKYLSEKLKSFKEGEHKNAIQWYKSIKKSIL